MKSKQSELLSIRIVGSYAGGDEYQCRYASGVVRTFDYVALENGREVVFVR